MNSPSLATKCVAHPQRLVAFLYILTFCVPVTINLRPVDYRHFSQHSSSTDFCLSLLNYLHGGFLIRSRFLPFTAQLLTHGFLIPFQIPTFLCSTIDTWVSYSVPDSCLSMLNSLNLRFLVRSRFLPFTAQLFTHGFLIPLGSCLSVLNYWHMDFLFRSRFLPFSAQLLTHRFLIPFQIPAFQCSTQFTPAVLGPFQIPAFHCSTIYTWVSWSVPDSCLSLPNYINVGFLVRSRFLPFTD